MARCSSPPTSPSSWTARPSRPAWPRPSTATTPDRPASGQQPARVPVPGAPHAGQGEEVAAAERLHVVGERLTGQPFLDRLELAPDVLLVGDEDVPGPQVAVPVHAQVVVVGAAHQPLA